MTTIYTVSATRSPGESVDVKAFESKSDARAFVKQCKTWETNKDRLYIELMAFPAGDEGQYRMRRSEWNKSIPYGSAAALLRLNAFDLFVTSRTYATADEAALEMLVFNATAKSSDVAALNKIL